MEVRYLIPEAPITHVIYQVPKIHENQEVPPPGKPIVSGVHSLFTHLGKCLDVFLQSYPI